MKLLEKWSSYNEEKGLQPVKLDIPQSILEKLPQNFDFNDVKVKVEEKNTCQLCIKQEESIKKNQGQVEDISKNPIPLYINPTDFSEENEKKDDYVNGGRFNYSEKISKDIKLFDVKVKVTFYKIEGLKNGWLPNYTNDSNENQVLREINSQNKVIYRVKDISKYGIGIRKGPDYPGLRIGIDIHGGEYDIIESVDKKVEYNGENVMMRFYKLKDQRGWIFRSLKDKETEPLLEELPLKFNIYQFDKFSICQKHLNIPKCFKCNKNYKLKLPKKDADEGNICNGTQVKIGKQYPFYHCADCSFNESYKCLFQRNKCQEFNFFTKSHCYHSIVYINEYRNGNYWSCDTCRESGNEFVNGLCYTNAMCDVNVCMKCLIDYEENQQHHLDLLDQLNQNQYKNLQISQNLKKYLIKNLSQYILFAFARKNYYTDPSFQQICKTILKNQQDSYNLLLILQQQQLELQKFYGVDDYVISYDQLTLQPDTVLGYALQLLETVSTMVGVQIQNINTNKSNKYFENLIKYLDNSSQEINEDGKILSQYQHYKQLECVSILVDHILQNEYPSSLHHQFQIKDMYCLINFYDKLFDQYIQILDIQEKQDYEVKVESQPFAILKSIILKLQYHIYKFQKINKDRGNCEQLHKNINNIIEKSEKIIQEKYYKTLRDCDISEQNLKQIKLFLITLEQLNGSHINVKVKKLKEKKIDKIIENDIEIEENVEEDEVEDEEENQEEQDEIQNNFKQFTFLKKNNEVKFSENTINNQIIEKIYKCQEILINNKDYQKELKKLKIFNYNYLNFIIKLQKVKKYEKDQLHCVPQNLQVLMEKIQNEKYANYHQYQEDLKEQQIQMSLICQKIFLGFQKLIYQQENIKLEAEKQKTKEELKAAHFKFSKKYKGKDFVINGYKALQKGDSERFTLCEPFIPQNQISKFKFKIIDAGGWTGIGVAIQKDILREKYMFSRYQNYDLNHGSYIISTNGYRWNTHFNNENLTTEGGFSFTTGDVINVEVNPAKKKIFFQNKNNKAFLSYKGSNNLVPCINCCNRGHVEIINVTGINSSGAGCASGDDEESQISNKLSSQQFFQQFIQQQQNVFSDLVSLKKTEGDIQLFYEQLQESGINNDLFQFYQQIFNQYQKQQKQPIDFYGRQMTNDFQELTEEQLEKEEDQYVKFQHQINFKSHKINNNFKTFNNSKNTIQDEKGQNPEIVKVACIDLNFLQNKENEKIQKITYKIKKQESNQKIQKEEKNENSQIFIGVSTDKNYFQDIGYQINYKKGIKKEKDENDTQSDEEDDSDKKIKSYFVSYNQELIQFPSKKPIINDKIDFQFDIQNLKNGEGVFLELIYDQKKEKKSINIKCNEKQYQLKIDEFNDDYLSPVILVQNMDCTVQVFQDMEVSEIKKQTEIFQQDNNKVKDMIQSLRLSLIDNIQKIACQNNNYLPQIFLDKIQEQLKNQEYLEQFQQKSQKILQGLKYNQVIEILLKLEKQSYQEIIQERTIKYKEIKEKVDEVQEKLNKIKTTKDKELEKIDENEEEQEQEKKDDKKKEIEKNYDEKIKQAELELNQQQKIADQHSVNTYKYIFQFKDRQVAQIQIIEQLYNQIEKSDDIQIIQLINEIMYNFYNNSIGNENLDKKEVYEQFLGIFMKFQQKFTKYFNNEDPYLNNFIFLCLQIIEYHAQDIENFDVIKLITCVSQTQYQPQKEISFIYFLSNLIVNKTQLDYKNNETELNYLKANLELTFKHHHYIYQTALTRLTGGYIKKIENDGSESSEEDTENKKEKINEIDYMEEEYQKEPDLMKFYTNKALFKERILLSEQQYLQYYPLSQEILKNIVKNNKDDISTFTQINTVDKLTQTPQKIMEIVEFLIKSFVQSQINTVYNLQQKEGENQKNSGIFDQVMCINILIQLIKIYPLIVPEILQIDIYSLVKQNEQNIPQKLLNRLNFESENPSLVSFLNFLIIFIPYSKEYSKQLLICLITQHFGYHIKDLEVIQEVDQVGNNSDDDDDDLLNEDKLLEKLNNKKIQKKIIKKMVFSGEGLKEILSQKIYNILINQICDIKTDLDLIEFEGYWELGQDVKICKINMAQYENLLKIVYKSPQIQNIGVLFLKVTNDKSQDSNEEEDEDEDGNKIQNIFSVLKSKLYQFHKNNYKIKLGGSKKLTQINITDSEDSGFKHAQFYYNQKMAKWLKQEDIYEGFKGSDIFDINSNLQQYIELQKQKQLFGSQEHQNPQEGKKFKIEEIFENLEQDMKELQKCDFYKISVKNFKFSTEIIQKFRQFEEDKEEEQNKEFEKYTNNEQKRKIFKQQISKFNEEDLKSLKLEKKIQNYSKLECQTIILRSLNKKKEKNKWYSLQDPNLEDMNLEDIQKNYYLKITENYDSYMEQAEKSEKLKDKICINFGDIFQKSVINQYIELSEEEKKKLEQQKEEQKQEKTEEDIKQEKEEKNKQNKDLGSKLNKEETGELTRSEKIKRMFQKLREQQAMKSFEIKQNEEQIFDNNWQDCEIKLESADKEKFKQILSQMNRAEKNEVLQKIDLDFIKQIDENLYKESIKLRKKIFPKYEEMISDSDEEEIKKSRPSRRRNNYEYEDDEEEGYDSQEDNQSVQSDNSMIFQDEYLNEDYQAIFTEKQFFQKMPVFSNEAITTLFTFLFTSYRSIADNDYKDTKNVEEYDAQNIQQILTILRQLCMNPTNCYKIHDTIFFILQLYQRRHINALQNVSPLFDAIISAIQKDQKIRETNENEKDKSQQVDDHKKDLYNGMFPQDIKNTMINILLKNEFLSKLMDGYGYNFCIRGYISEQFGKLKLFDDEFQQDKDSNINISSLPEIQKARELLQKSYNIKLNSEKQNLMTISLKVLNNTSYQYNNSIEYFSVFKRWSKINSEFVRQDGDDNNNNSRNNIALKNILTEINQIQMTETQCKKQENKIILYPNFNILQMLYNNPDIAESYFSNYNVDDESLIQRMFNSIPSMFIQTKNIFKQNSYNGQRKMIKILKACNVFKQKFFKENTSYNQNQSLDQQDGVKQSLITEIVQQIYDLPVVAQNLNIISNLNDNLFQCSLFYKSILEKQIYKRYYKKNGLDYENYEKQLKQIQKYQKSDKNLYQKKKLQIQLKKKQMKKQIRKEVQMFMMDQILQVQDLKIYFKMLIDFVTFLAKFLGSEYPSAFENLQSLYQEGIKALINLAYLFDFSIEIDEQVKQNILKDNQSDKEDLNSDEENDELMCMSMPKLSKLITNEPLAQKAKDGAKMQHLHNNDNKDKEHQQEEEILDNLPSITKQVSKFTTNQLVQQESQQQTLNQIFDRLFSKVYLIVSDSSYFLDSFDNSVKKYYQNLAFSKVKSNSLIKKKLEAIKSISVQRAEKQSKNNIYREEKYNLIERSAPWMSTIKNVFLAYTPPEIIIHDLRVKYNNESGLDWGGLKNEWLTMLTNEVFHPNFGLFILSSNKNSVQPNPFAFLVPDYQQHFRFLGRLIGKALIENWNLEVTFAQSFLKHVLDKDLCVKDLQDIDPEYAKNLQWLLDNEINEDLCLDLNFTYVQKLLGTNKTKIVELIPNGNDIEVTQENKKQYVKLVSKSKMTDHVEKQTVAFKQGLYDIIPKYALQFLSVQELGLHLSGMPTLDIEKLRKYCRLEGYQDNDLTIQYFFEVLEELDETMRANLIFFFSGSFKIPLDGFKDNPLVLEKVNDPNMLPVAHTCFYTIELPDYKNKSKLKEKLIQSLLEGYQGFHIV